MRSCFKAASLFLAPAKLAIYRNDHQLLLGHDSERLDRITSNLVMWSHRSRIDDGPLGYSVPKVSKKKTVPQMRDPLARYTAMLQPK